MRIKSYFASTVEAALDLARRELGEEAVLLNAKPSPPEARHMGIHEVVFGVEREHDRLLSPAAESASVAGSSAPLAKAMAVSQTALTAPRVASAGGPAPEWEALRLQMEKLERAVVNHLFQASMPGQASLPGQPTPATGARPSTTALAGFLAEHDFPGPLAEELAGSVERELASWTSGSPGTGTRRSRPPADAHTPHAAGQSGVFRWAPGEAAAEFRQRGIVAEVLLDCLGSRLAAGFLPAEEASARPGPRILALCGPPGGGKTTMLAKLAAFFSLNLRQNVAILSTDTIRIAAADQLRTYAAIMGLPIEVLETPRALDRALEEQAHRQIILLDTPGGTPSGSGGDSPASDTGAWAEYLCRHEEIEKHLVLPAYLSARHVQTCAARFRPCGVSRLVLTHADELSAGGGLVAAVLLAGLPVSYLGTGQSIPEDFEPATLDRLLDLAFADESFLASPPPEPLADKWRPPGRAEAAAASGPGRELAPV